MRLVFDIDNTIAMHYEGIKDYPTDALPNKTIIKLMRELKKLGCEIVLFTARKMQSSGHNVGKSIARGGYKTFKWLEKYDVPFDEIHFGKPNADIYFDDKGLGFTQNKMESKLHDLIKELKK